MPRYDFAHPKFRNGMVTFDVKKPDLLYEFRQAVIRRRYVLRPDMYLYSPSGERIAKVENYGHMLLITMLNTKKIKKIFSKMEIEQFFNKINENTVFNRKIDMNLNEAKQILRKNGFIVERKGDFYEPSSRPEFFDPDYGKEELPEYTGDASDNCANYASDVEDYIKAKYPNLTVSVNCNFDVYSEKIEYVSHVRFKFDTVPTLDDIFEVEGIVAEIADNVDNYDIPFEDGGTKIYAVTNNKRQDITNYIGKDKQLPEGLNADYYEVDVLSYGKEELPEYDPDDRDYDF